MTDRPKRILYVQAPTGGGSTISLYELVKGLDKTQYQPVVLFLEVNQYLEKFNQLGIQTLTLSRTKYKNRKQSLVGNMQQLIFADLPLSINIVSLLKKEKIDLIHHNLGFDRAFMIAAFITKIPQVCHFRNFYRRLPLFSKVLISSVNAVFYTTHAIANHYSKIGISIAKNEVVYEPIDTDLFSQKRDVNLIRKQFITDNNDYLVSNIGRITPWKGQHYFLQAAADIIKRHPNIKILIVGSPSETQKDKQYLALLQNTVRESSLQNHVIFTGNRDDIPDIMAASDIVVHSACQPEPFGLVIAEAMASGTPVIATRGGGTPEIIADGITGFLVPMHSADAIRQAIQKLMESKELREEIAIKAKQSVCQRFSIKQHVGKIQKIYAEILNETLGIKD